MVCNWRLKKDFQENVIICYDSNYIQMYWCDGRLSIYIYIYSYNNCRKISIVIMMIDTIWHKINMDQTLKLDHLSGVKNLHNINFLLISFEFRQMEMGSFFFYRWSR